MLETTQQSVADEIFESIQKLSDLKGVETIRNTFLATHANNDLKQVILRGFPIEIIKDYALYKVETSDDTNRLKLQLLEDTIRTMPAVKRGGIRLV